MVPCSTWNVRATPCSAWRHWTNAAPRMVPCECHTPCAECHTDGAPLRVVHRLWIEWGQRDRQGARCRPDGGERPDRPSSLRKLSVEDSLVEQRHKLPPGSCCPRSFGRIFPCVSMGKGNDRSRNEVRAGLYDPLADVVRPYWRTLVCPCGGPIRAFSTYPRFQGGPGGSRGRNEGPKGRRKAQFAPSESNDPRRRRGRPVATPSARQASLGGPVTRTRPHSTWRPRSMLSRT